VSQTGKNLATLGVLAVLAAGAGLYAFYGVKKGDEAEAERKDAESLLIAREEGPDRGSADLDVRRLVVEAKGERTTLERASDGWRIVAPVKTRVDKVVVDGLVSQISSGKVTRTIEENPTAEDLKRYGLDMPKFVVTAKLDEGREIVLRGGIENTFDGSVYLQRGGDPKVYSAMGGLRWALEKTTYDLRDKAILAMPEATKVRRLQLKGPTHGYTVDSEDGKRWKVTAPRAFAADAQAVTSLTAAFNGERATAFVVDSAEERKRLGLDRPVATATVTLDSGEPIQLSVSKVEEAGATKYYALRQQGEETIIGEVGESALGVFDRDPVLLQDKAVITFDKEKVERMVFRKKGSPEIVVERVRSDAGNTEDWRVVEPTEGPAQKWKLTSLLWTLGSLKAQTLGEENPKSWAKWGLDSPDREVELFDGSGKSMAHLRVGSTAEGQPTVRYVRGTRDQVLEIDGDRLSELPDAVDAVLQAAPGADAGN